MIENGKFCSFLIGKGPIFRPKLGLGKSCLFLFSNKILVFRAGIHKMLARIANREDPDQTTSKEAV